MQSWLLIQYSITVTRIAGNLTLPYLTAKGATTTTNNSCYQKQAPGPSRISPRETGGLFYASPPCITGGAMILLNTPIATIPGRQYCITTVSSVQVIAIIDGEEFDLLGSIPVSGQAQFVAPTSRIEVRSTSAPEEGESGNEAAESSQEASSVMFDGSTTPIAGDAASVIAGNIVEIVRS